MARNSAPLLSSRHHHLSIGGKSGKLSELFCAVLCTTGVHNDTYKVVVRCQNKIVLRNFRPVGRPS